MVKKTTLSRPMSKLGWEIATTLPVSTAASVDDLVTDCLRKPWFADPQPVLPWAEARKLVTDVLGREVRPLVNRLAGPDSLVITRVKKAGSVKRYSLTLAAQRRVNEEFQKTFSGFCEKSALTAAGAA